MNVRPIVAQATGLLRASKRNILATNVVGIRNSSAYKAPATHKPAHYNELPLPQGSWQTHYDTQQKKYTLHLIGGIAFFLGTVTFIKASGIIFFNFSPPPIPEGGFK